MSVTEERDDIVIISDGDKSDNRNLSNTRKIGKSLKVITPCVYLIYYIMSIASTVSFDFSFFAKCVLLFFVAVDLVFNIKTFSYKLEPKEKRKRKKFKRIRRYFKILISLGTCVMAIYDAALFRNSVIRFIGALVIIIFFAIRVLIEILILIAERLVKKFIPSLK